MSQTSQGEIDPVSGMTVAMEEARADGRTIEHQGRTYGSVARGAWLSSANRPELCGRPCPAITSLPSPLGGSVCRYRFSRAASD